MDRDLGALSGDHHDHFEQVPGRVWADGKLAVGVFASVFKCECMLDRVEDVCVDSYEDPDAMSSANETAMTCQMNVLPRPMSARYPASRVSNHARISREPFADESESPLPSRRR